jgi:hypothetical protein
MTPTTQADPVWLTLLLRVKELGVWLFPLAAGSLYVAGFLVLNSHLARFGFMDIEFVNSRYFLSGASFVFYLACFYLFAGRAVLFTPTWLKEDLAHLNRAGARPIWSVVVFAHANLNAFFFACLSAALFTNFAVSSAQTTTFYMALGGAFFVSYTLDITNLDIRFPRASEAANILVKSIAVAVFFLATSVESILLSVLIGYGGIFLFINLAIDAFVRRGVTKDRISFTALYSLVVVFGSAAAYGNYIYGDVSSKFGGAKSRTVYIGLKDDLGMKLPEAITLTAGGALLGRLVHQTEKHTYVSSAGHTIRVRSDDIDSLTIIPDVESHFWAEYFAQRIGE